MPGPVDPDSPGLDRSRLESLTREEIPMKEARRLTERVYTNKLRQVIQQGARFLGARTFGAEIYNFFASIANWFSSLRQALVPVKAARIVPHEGGKLSTDELVHAIKKAPRPLKARIFDELSEEQLQQVEASLRDQRKQRLLAFAPTGEEERVVSAPSRLTVSDSEEGFEEVGLINIDDLERDELGDDQSAMLSRIERNKETLLERIRTDMPNSAKQRLVVTFLEETRETLNHFDMMGPKFLEQIRDEALEAMGLDKYDADSPYVNAITDASIEPRWAQLPAAPIAEPEPVAPAPVEREPELSAIQRQADFLREQIPLDNWDHALKVIQITLFLEEAWLEDHALMRSFLEELKATPFASQLSTEEVARIQRASHDDRWRPERNFFQEASRLRGTLESLPPLEEDDRTAVIASIRSFVQKGVSEGEITTVANFMRQALIPFAQKNGGLTQTEYDLLARDLEGSTLRLPPGIRK